MGVYQEVQLGLLPEREVSALIGKLLILSVSFRRTDSANNNFAVMNIRSGSKSVFVDFISGNERSAEYSLSRLFARQARVASQRITWPSVAMSVTFMYTSCSTTSIWLLQNLVLPGVGFCAILYTAIAAVSETILLALPPKSFLLSLSLRRLISVFKFSWLIIYLDRDMRSERRAPAAIFSSLSAVFSSVGFHMPVRFLVAPANRE